MNSRELINRWDEQSTKLALKQLRGAFPPDVFGRTEDGRWDLRGLVIREILRDLTIVDVNFSHCRLERAGQFLFCKLTNVDLTCSKLKTNMYGSFSLCTFENSNLTDAWLHGTFSKCSFANSKLRNASGKSVSFSDCRFDNADLFGVHFLMCRIESCSWNNTRFGNGSLARSKFIGGHPGEVGNTIMNRVEMD